MKRACARHERRRALQKGGEGGLIANDYETPVSVTKDVTHGRGGGIKNSIMPFKY